MPTLVEVQFLVLEPGALSNVWSKSTAAARALSIKKRLLWLLAHRNLVSFLGYIIMEAAPNLKGYMSLCSGSVMLI